MDDLQGGTLALEHRYDLKKRAGEFALFEIYKGLQHPFERPIWVKVCSAPAEHRAPDYYDRLKTAVVAAASFDHPHALRVVDFGDFRTHVPFVVTERHDGVNLLDLLNDQGTLAPEDALRIAKSVGEVVADAHAAGIVHGGLAPRWVTVTDEGDVYVDHFRLHPTMAEIREMDGAILTSDLLWPLAPEQFGDEEVQPTETGDVWALGALLYWMLTGVHPYYEDPTDTSDAVLRLRNKTRPPSLGDLGFDAQVAELVERAMAPKADERFADMAELIDALGTEQAPVVAPAAVTITRPAATPTVQEPRALGTALAAAVGLVLLTNLAWFFYHTATESEAAPGRAPAATPSILPVGVELETVPPGAKVLLRNDGEAEFGDTPMVLDPKAGKGKLELRIRAHGHDDVDVDVESGPAGHQLILHLPGGEGDAQGEGEAEK